MLDLHTNIVRIVELVAIIMMVPWLTVIVAALLMRQLRWFGFGEARINT